MSLNRSSCRRLGLALTLLLLCSGCGTYRWQWPLVRVCPMCPIDSGQYAVLSSPDGSLGTNYLQSGPVLAGTEFSTTQHKQASERALELQHENDQLKALNTTFEQRVAELGREQESNDKALLRAEEEVEHAHQELSAMHSELESWRAEMLKLHERLRHSDREHLQSLDQVSSLLNQMLQQQGTTLDDTQTAPVRPVPAPVPLPILDENQTQPPDNL